MSDTQHENGMFFARRVKLTKNLPSSDHFTQLNSNVDQIEFAWLNIYNPPHCFTPEPVDFQHFVQGAFAQGFVPFGVYLGVTSPGAETAYSATNPADVLNPKSVHDMLMKCDEVVHTGLWRMNAKHSTHSIKDLIDAAVDQSPIYKALKDADLNPQKTMQIMDYQCSEEGGFVMMYKLMLVIDDVQYMNRFGAFAKIAKQFNLQIFDLNKKLTA